MPELPEVETVRQGLVEVLVGRPITSVAVSGSRSVRRQSPAQFEAALTGATITNVARHGKYLYARIGSSDAHLVIHLRMSGKLVFVAKDEPVEPHTHIVIALSGTDELRFVDPRTFGEMFVTDEMGPDGRPALLHHLGVDPLLQPVSLETIALLTKGRKVALKTFLLDQRAIAGIGAIYGDEICFRARLSPKRRVDSLTAPQRKALSEAIESVLGEAVKLRGSSLKDESYRDLFGSLGSYQSQHAVYGRSGLACVSCGGPIEKVRLAGRYAHFCRRCQR